MRETKYTSQNQACHSFKKDINLNINLLEISKTFSKTLKVTNLYTRINENIIIENTSSVELKILLAFLLVLLIILLWILLKDKILTTIFNVMFFFISLIILHLIKKKQKAKK